jgi:hypothetical protein
VIPRWLARYWGYVVLALLLSSWLEGWPELAPVSLFPLSLAVIFYSLFQAPVWCGADNRDGTSCRRNAYGLLRGCSFRQHKWQKMKQAFVPDKWRELNRGLWTDPKTGLATMTSLLGIVSAVGALVRH